MKNIAVYYSYKNRTLELVDYFNGCGLNAHPLELSLQNLYKNTRYDCVVFVILHGRKKRLFLALLQALFLKIFRKKIIRFWVGSDVLFLKSNNKMKLYSKVFNCFTDLNAVQAQWFEKQLFEVGIDSDFFPLMLPEKSTIKGEVVPGSFSILAYLPSDRHVFYGSEMVFNLAKDFPEIDFLIVANDGEGMPRSNNLQFLGWVDDMDKLFDKVNLLIRMPQHDGLSVMLIEAMLHNRIIVTNQEIPGCFYANDYEHLKEIIGHALSGEYRTEKEEYEMFVDGLYLSRDNFYDKVIAL